MIKRILNTLYISAFILIGIYIALPLKILRISDISRGKELINNIENYKNTHTKLPQNQNWSTLKEIGFTDDELNRAYPAYNQINDSVYQLIFFQGFDPPYLFWNSNEQIWKEGCP